MPDSPQQMLEAIAVALTEEVAPHVDDPFAQMQCKAAAELLANLAGELDWAPAPRQARNQQLRAIRDALRRSGWPGAKSDSAVPPARDEPEATRAALLAELREGMEWLAGAPEAAATEVDQVLRADLDQQVAALRRGMFR